MQSEQMSFHSSTEDWLCFSCPDVSGELVPGHPTIKILLSGSWGPHVVREREVGGLGCMVWPCLWCRMGRKHSQHSRQIPFEWIRSACVQGCSIMGKIIITIILVNIVITIIQTIIFESENVLYLFTMSLPKKTL